MTAVTPIPVTDVKAGGKHIGAGGRTYVVKSPFVIFYGYFVKPCNNPPCKLESNSS